MREKHEVQSEIDFLRQEIKKRHLIVAQFVWMRTCIEDPLSPETIKKLTKINDECEQIFREIEKRQAELDRIESPKEYCFDGIELTAVQIKILATLNDLYPNLKKIRPFCLLVNEKSKLVREEVKHLLMHGLVSERLKGYNAELIGYLLTQTGREFYSRLKLQ